MWFDDPDYADVVIVLDDGSRINAHKIVLCKRSEYFRMLCGQGSQFAVRAMTSPALYGAPLIKCQERNQRDLPIRDDDPAALTAVVKYLYLCKWDELPSATPGWNFFLNVKLTADKYLLSTLSAKADTAFREAASAVTDIGQAYPIIQRVNSMASHDDYCVGFAETLRRDNLGQLLRHERYRTDLDADADLL